LRTAGFVAAGVGGLGLVTFVVAGLSAKSAYHELEQDCGGARCSDSQHQSDVERGKTWQTIANVGLIAGGVGAVTGGALLYFGYRDANHTALALVPGGAVLTTRGKF
jgi:hypothetical protein